LSRVAEEILDRSLVEQVELLQSGEVSVVALTEAALDRAERLQASFNSFIAIDREVALTRAQALDATPAAQRRSLRLFGAPVAQKDMYGRKGRVVTFGSRLYANHRAAATATVVQRFDDAGAVDIGSLNMSEFASNPYGLNILVGPARNPWDRERIAGGSSSGSAVALATRIVAASMGSDTGGSTRIPAACCGVFGLLPTNGRISRHGMLPLSFSLDNPGPLARSARDMARVLGIVAGHDTNDAYTSREPVYDYESGIEGGVRGLRIATAIDCDPYAVDADTARMMAATAAILHDLGAVIVPLHVPDPQPLDALANLIITAEAASYHRDDLSEHAELYTPLVRDRVQFGFSFDAPSYVDALRLRGRELGRFMEAVFAKADALLLPALPHPAPLHADVEAAISGKGDLSFSLGRFTRSINYLGLPSLAVPHGRNGQGLPLALQIVGRPFDEGLLLRIAHAFEKAVPPRFPDLRSTSAAAGSQPNTTSQPSELDIVK
jgi:aspartyl-tRNA(Asn)/glutamyl-tRNA(Gln) amidotransferase subunit A